MKYLSSLVALLAFLLVGCAGTKQYVPMPNQSRPVDDPAKGRIYVMRPASIGSAVSMGVTDGGKPIGVTGPHGYLCWERQPGDTIVTSSSESENRLSLRVEASKVYYLFQHLRMGVWVARSELELLKDENEAREVLKKCKPAKVQLFDPPADEPATKP
jgi:hypothetical protein